VTSYDRVRLNVKSLGPSVAPTSTTAADNDGAGSSGASPPTSAFDEIELEFLRLIAKNSKFSITPQQIPLAHAKDINAESSLSIATISTSLLYRTPQSLASAPPPPGKKRIPNHFKAISRSHDQYRMFTLENHLSVDEMREFLFRAVLDTGRALKEFEEKDIPAPRTEDARRIIVINEFGFPFPLEEKEREQFLRDVEHAMVHDVTMADFWESCYLVFGSYHCHSEMKNSAVISLPYRPPLAGPYPDEATEERVNSFRPHEIGGDDPSQTRFNFIQDKIVPAERIGERLRARDSVHWNYYDTEMGRIGVLICFDAIDPRMLLRLALVRLRDTNTTKTEFSAIIVPCFSRDDHVLESCRLLSSVMDTLVIYANVHYADKGATSFEVPNPASPRKTSQAYFYRGEEITKDSRSPEIVSRDIEPAVVGDKVKNLWYTRHFLNLDRATLHNMHLTKNAFSPLFLDIFDPKVRTNLTIVK
jgi:hypothetical protein